MRKTAITIAVMLGISGCSVGVSTSGGAGGTGVAVTAGPPASQSECAALFRRFDLRESLLSTPTGYRDRVVAPPELMVQADALRRAGCMTKTADLTGLNDLPPGPVTDSGPPIAPTTIHAGVVTNMNDDARVLAAFNERGIRARSVGSGALGRRVYLGPFTTQGALEEGVTLARQAGFVSPYMKSF